MPRLRSPATARLLVLVATSTALLAVAAGCGGSSHARNGAELPGTGKPEVTIGDKNFTEQFVLGQLYLEALQAQGYNVVINRNIGPTEVTIQALASGRIGMYPEYVYQWDQSVAGIHRTFTTARAAYQAGQNYALAHGFELLDPTPFSDTDAIAVSLGYGIANALSTIGDLSKLDPAPVFGGPLQFQQEASGLPAVERAYGFIPAAFKPLAIGAQYPSLDASGVQAADVNTTDGQLLSGRYTLLSDPLHVFGWGNVVPVVSVHVLQTEGPEFAATINRVSALLTLPVIRTLNAQVDVFHRDPTKVARQFLVQHGLARPSGQ